MSTLESAANESHKIERIAQKSIDECLFVEPFDLSIKYEEPNLRPYVWALFIGGFWSIFECNNGITFSIEIGLSLPEK